MLELYYYPSYVSLLPHILLHEIGLEHRLIFVDRYADVAPWITNHQTRGSLIRNVAPP